jgi:SecD/SecF fusion protein
MFATLTVVFLIAGCAVSGSATSAVTSERIEFRFASEDATPGHEATTNPLDASTIYLAPEAFLNHKHIQSGRVVDLVTGDPAVEITLTPEGSERLRRISAQNLGKLVAILVDGRVITAVPIQSELKLPSVVLVADFERAEAERLARDLSQTGQH